MVRPRRHPSGLQRSESYNASNKEALALTHHRRRIAPLYRVSARTFGTVQEGRRCNYSPFPLLYFDFIPFLGTVQRVGILPPLNKLGVGEDSFVQYGTDILRQGIKTGQIEEKDGRANVGFAPHVGREDLTLG